MVTDPISDFLIRLKNGSAVRRENIVVPFSLMKQSLAELLSREGYVGKVRRTSSGSLEVELKYGPQGRPAVTDAKRISKPSRRLYRGVREIHPVKRGHGLLVLSTPHGVLTGAEARKKNAGGEVLFEIW